MEVNRFVRTLATQQFQGRKVFKLTRLPNFFSMQVGLPEFYIIAIDLKAKIVTKCIGFFVPLSFFYLAFITIFSVATYAAIHLLL